ncbi:MAG TPA: hypothetical protein VLX91_05550 [Candidatus Acidoferrales bacterium]|nr:hypothetical protein [Candidatus Acidoferrales bacterium]
MKKYYLFFCTIALQCILAVSTFAQDSSSTPTYGLTASFQSSQLDILVPIWVSKMVSLAPAVGLAWEDGTGADLHIGIVPRFYLTKKKVSPYLGLQIAMLKIIPAGGAGVASTTDWLAGLAFGGEYFFDEHLSFGVESQANFTYSDQNSSRFGNPGKTNLNTAAAVFATVYF